MILSTFLTAAVPLLAPQAAVPESRPIPDVDVARVVDRELVLDPAVSAHGIDVTADSGVVSLTGTVPHLLAKERAARIAETVRGVRAVVDRLDVRRRTDRTDAEVRDDVMTALLDDPATDSYELAAEVHDGHVLLTGTVDSWAERELAISVAKGVRGVVAVSERIEVDVTIERPDDEIRQEVVRTLEWNTLVDHGLIEVEVVDGTVYLSGVVGSVAERTRARADAWTAGVVAVDDSELRVARWARDPELRADKYVLRSDEEVHAALEAALRQDPRVRRHGVVATVEGGFVTLRGVVGDLKAKRAAEHDAERTVGVAAVQNLLKVRPGEERSEDAIARDVGRAFARDPYLDRNELTPLVRDGTVHLHGTVDSYFEKAHADDVAARVKGVTDVSNHLDVDDRPHAYDPYVDPWSIYAFDWYREVPVLSFQDDQRLREDVERELWWSPFVDADQVEITVAEGTVTLTGTVDSWLERGAAKDNAYEAGASFVRNRLRVSSAARPGGDG